ncbi:MAG: 3-oxoacyl-ACP synthase III [Planctomycetota bacterium]|nr:MAG: 3-oxoacyl-ACP synthase III [Planctomycetota bacterium]
MRYESVCLAGFGYELPPRVVTSLAIEDALAPLYQKLDLPPGRLELISGVRERRFWEEGTTPSSVSIRTAGEAIERAGFPRERIGALVHTSVSRDFLEPATASVVAGALDLPAAALVFDISNACLGFLDGLVTVANMIELGQIEAGVVVATEAGEGLVDATIADLNAKASNGISRKSIKPAFASLTIGSGSVAALLARRDATAPRPRLLGGAFRQATEHNALCRSAPDQGFAGGAHPLMETRSEKVLEHGCALANETWVAFKRELGWDETTPDAFFCHQVGAGYRRTLFSSLGLDLERDQPTLEFLGNIGSVSLPLGLALAERDGRLRAGDRLALLGIGSGLNCMMLGVEWA